MKLERLAYISQATDPASIMAVSDILAQSLRNNPANNITGALAYTETRFVQVLEGSHGSLDVLLLKLAMDSRHCDMQVMDRIYIGERQFGGWSMISPTFTPEGRARLAILIENHAQRLDDFSNLLLDMVAEQVVTTAA